MVAPMLPSKVVAIGRNYADHAQGDGQRGPSEPMIFLKPSTSGIGRTTRPSPIPRTSTQHVDYEGELAVVIGRLCRDVPVERAKDVIFGSNT